MGMVISCPGCRRAVSEWAARCPTCATDLADGVVLAHENWDTSVPRPDVSGANDGRRRRQPAVRAAAGIALVVAASAAVLVVANAPRRHPRSAHQVICATPTATWSPATPTQDGAPGAAQVGPLTFHPSYLPGQPDSPTQVVLHAVTAVTAALTLTGWSCDTGRPFRFWYPPYRADSQLPQPISRAPTEGGLTMSVPILASGDDLVGEILFPGAGRWDVEVWEGQALVGNILFVLPGPGR